MIIDFFRTILYQPLLNGLVLLYEYVAFEDLGVAIILLTVMVRIILFPLFHKTAKHQKIAQKIQPEVKKIQTKHKNNREAQTKALMALYQEHNVNPLTPIFLLVLQLPILFALYRLFINGFNGDSLALIYSVLFWYFAHPLWTERWVEITGGTWLTTSNFICGLIYIGGFAVWNRFYLYVVK